MAALPAERDVQVEAERHAGDGGASQRRQGVARDGVARPDRERRVVGDEVAADLRLVRHGSPGILGHRLATISGAFEPRHQPWRRSRPFVRDFDRWVTIPLGSDTDAGVTSTVSARFFRPVRAAIAIAAILMASAVTQAQPGSAAAKPAQKPPQKPLQTPPPNPAQACEYITPEEAKGLLGMDASASRAPSRGSFTSCGYTSAAGDQLTVYVADYGLPSIAKEFFDKTREVLKTATNEDTLGVPAFMHMTPPGPLVTPQTPGAAPGTARRRAGAGPTEGGASARIVVSRGRRRKHAHARARRPRRRDAARAEGSPHGQARSLGSAGHPAAPAPEAPRHPHARRRHASRAGAAGSRAAAVGQPPAAGPPNHERAR